jgi:hypothetical protein
MRAPVGNDVGNGPTPAAGTADDHRGTGGRDELPRIDPASAGSHHQRQYEDIGAHRRADALQDGPGRLPAPGPGDREGDDRGESRAPQAPAWLVDARRQAASDQGEVMTDPRYW